METKSLLENTVVERLRKLGFHKAASDLSSLMVKKRKLAIAYEHYRYVKPEKVAQFNAELLKQTVKNSNSIANMEYQRLEFVPIEHYHAVPPEDVLQKLEEAQGRKCFDSFEVAYIKNVKDPLLFGRIDGTPNRFFVAQWDNDVSITDLLEDNEG